MKINVLHFLLIFIFYGCNNVKEPAFGQPRENPLEIELNENVEIIGLLYHRFDEGKYPSTSISSTLFRQQLSYLKNNHFKVLKLSDAIQKLTSMDTDANEKFIVITIDDAFNSFMDNGYPVIKEFGFPATLFINTETVGSGDYINWNDLNLLVNNGIEIGNHTHSHDYFLNMDTATRYKSFLHDVQVAQDLIQSKLKVKPKVFAYPYGEYDEGMREVIRNMDFIGAAAQNSGVMSAYSDLYSMPRFPMTDQYGKIEAFSEKISMKALPVVKTIPSSSIAFENPPVLQLVLDKEIFDLRQIQCFVQGGKCILKELEGDKMSFQITADQQLKSRRHLYTVTIPSKDNSQWYWFSHQWVFPAKN